MPVLPVAIEAVVFDVGETLVDESRAWSALAEAAGLTPLTLFAGLGVLIERGEHHNGVWALLGTKRPQLRDRMRPDDLYPDVVGCLSGLSRAGYTIGLAGNQPLEAEAALAEIGLPVSFVVSSAGLGVEKPSPSFFEQVARRAGKPAEQIAYVGDRLDNDVLPAQAAGMWAVFIRRGPWGFLHSRLPEAASADARIDTLDELVPAPGGRRSGPGPS